MVKPDYSKDSHCAAGHDLRLEGAIEYHGGTKRRCVECRRIKDRKRKQWLKKRGKAPLPTHCPRGHEYTAANTMRVKGRKGRTRRMCRECLSRMPREGPEPGESWVAELARTRAIMALSDELWMAATSWDRARIKAQIAELTR